jgi:hypothetical protein
MVAPPAPSSGALMRLNTPTLVTFLTSLALVGLAVVSRLGLYPVPEWIPQQDFVLAVFGYVVLMLGNLIRGL